ncbi:4-carboxymuconolactone decarboxylase-like protein [Cenococcum geophilum]
MRLPYAPTTPPSPSLEPLYARIAARRAPRPLIPLDLALLHSPPWNSYAPLAFKAGISKEGLEMVLEYPVIGKGKGGDKNKEGGGLGEREWVMTRGVSVDEGVFKKVKGYLGEKDLVDWFLVALDVGENNGKPMKSVEDIVKGV